MKGWRQKAYSKSRAFNGLFRKVYKSSPLLSDLDECYDSDPCDENALCNNTIGSYECKCFRGYYGDGSMCGGDVYVQLFMLQWFGLLFPPVGQTGSPFAVDV